MRLTNMTSGRPTYYDRNPADTNHTFSATIGPSADTIQWTYTVPSNRKCFVEVVMVVAYRVTAAGAAGLVRSYIAIGQGGSSFVDIVLCLFNNNTVNFADRQSVPLTAALLATDVIRGVTADASTGGTVAFDVSSKKTEFDA